MSAELVKELLRNFENTLHDRLKVIEDILTSANKTSGETADLDPRILSDVSKRIDKAVGHIQSVEEYAMGEVRTLAYNHDMLEKRVELLEGSMRKAAETLLSLNDTIGSLQKRMDDGLPVEAAEVEAEIEETQEAALQEQEVEEEEEEEEEQEELDLEAFEYRKRSYAHDQHNRVYNMDEEGAADISEVVGIWNPKTKKIEAVPTS